MSEDKRPPERISVRFCPKCGRNDLRGNLGAEHYADGKLCAGKLIVVTYSLKE